VRGTFGMRIEGVGCVVGVRFRAGGFHAFARRSVAQWTDRTVPAEEAFATVGDHRAAGWARALWDAAVECRGDADAHVAIIRAHLDALLGARLSGPDPVAEEAADLVALIAGDPAVRRVGDLARASGRSERTLHRLFVRYVGVSPAWVIRRYRLHAAAQRLAACPETDVGGLAFELGYADQAHFIREFRATIGVTPGAYASARRQASGTALTWPPTTRHGPPPSRAQTRV
jgi:AraC-like DNA-binding protein